MAEAFDPTCCGLQGKAMKEDERRGPERNAGAVENQQVTISESSPLNDVDS